MCGILALSGTEIPFSHLLLKSLRSRGPDALGFWTDGTVQLAHARLSIIGLDERGTEPMEDHRNVLIYNGQIYNFEEIRRRLVAKGVAVSSANDARVLLHAWTLWGSKILKDLEGFWSFVVYDKKEKTLTLVRDQFGIKPLYYWRSGRKVVVSSLLKTIREVIGKAPDLDFEALSEYVRYQFTLGDKTFFRRVRKVLPGHIVTLDLRGGGVSESCYEDILAPAERPRRRITGKWIVRTRELLEACVHESEVSDTAITTFCSGGIDSSLITRIVAPELTYHGNFSDPACNETAYARRATADIATRLFVVNASETFDLVERARDILEDFDELSIGPVIFPLDDLMRQVKRRFKVVLTGTGGDELFGGYVRYQLAMGSCHQDCYQDLFDRVRALPTVAQRFELTHTKGRPEYYKFYLPQAENNFRNAFEECRRGDTELGGMLRFDRRHFLPGLLNIDDKIGGRHSLESRPSLLHQRLARHILSVDSRALLRGAELKSTLRAVAKGILPESVRNRSDKMGFTTPVGTFVNNSADLIREQVTNSRFSDFYHLERLNFTAPGKFSREVFGLLLLDLWLNRYAV